MSLAMKTITTQIDTHYNFIEVTHFESSALGYILVKVVLPIIYNQKI